MAYLKSNVIKTLYDIGADAMDNLSLVELQFPSILDPVAETTLRAKVPRKDHLTYRLEGDITLPQVTVTTVDYDYKTIKVKKPYPKISLDRKISLTFRLDSWYFVYQQLLFWRNLIYNGDAGGYVNQAISGQTISPELTGDSIDASALGSIKIYSFQQNLPSHGDGRVNSTADWEFKQVWIEKISEPKFVAAGKGAPQKVTVDFQFGEMVSPSSANKFADVTKALEDYKVQVEEIVSTEASAEEVELIQQTQAQIAIDTMEQYVTANNI